MSRPQDFGAVCEHGRLARKCERCDDADEIASLRDCAKQYEQWLAADHATIADLRDRLRILAPMVCEGCGCARAVFGHALCVDCEEAQWGIPRGAPVGDWGDRAAACVSVGMRALCGRRILEGC